MKKILCLALLCSAMASAQVEKTAANIADKASKTATHAVDKAAETVSKFVPEKKFGSGVGGAFKQGTSTLYGDVKDATETVYNDGKDIVKALTPEARDMLVKIANKLEKTTNQVWDILVRQQLVWSWSYLILTIGSILLWFRFYKQFGVMKTDLTEAKEVKESNIVILVLFGVVALVSTGFSSFHFIDMMTGFINPEYGAMKSIYQVYMSLNLK